MRKLNGCFQLMKSGRPGFFSKMGPIRDSALKTSMARVLPSKSQNCTDHFLKTRIDKVPVDVQTASMVNFLCEPGFVINLAKQWMHQSETNYLYNHFIFWLSAYVRNDASHLRSYFNDQEELNAVCGDFIKFCFTNKISLDENETLRSFDYHNSLSDKAVKRE